MRASNAKAKQIPTVATTVVSARPRRTSARTRRGTTSMPTASSTAKKPASRPTVRARAAASSRAPEAAAVSTARMRIAIRSSAIRIPSTISERVCGTFCSAKALAMMVVLEIASAAPAKRLSKPVQPIARAIR